MTATCIKVLMGTADLLLKTCLPGELKWEKGSTSSQKVRWFFRHNASALGVQRTATCKLYDFFMMVSTP